MDIKAIRTPGDNIVPVPNLVFLNTSSSSGKYGELHIMILMNFYLDHAANLQVIFRATLIAIRLA